ncbi:hypothetical protein M407DRAFT_199341 [Tulasnella calospora MUT 4182]|uniref:Uncharacterized protein n=1 Tax=Tulasnella calospora MUT 4182 TaxID=1051891 RepID=A0A0C3LYW6_9AGAM|nr:hypothetical protein M407DRAFT_199341 [Tulasnella calospora MUT 4182]
MMARLVANAQTFKIDVSSIARHQIMIGGLDITLRLDNLPPGHSQETLDWVFTRLGKPVEDIAFHLYLDSWRPELAHLEWLARRLTVTKLTVRNNPYCSTAPPKIIPSLSRPTASTPVTWLLPQVEIIETNLVWENGNADIVEMIRSRHSAEDGKDGVAAPVPFHGVLARGPKGRKRRGYILGKRKTVMRQITDTVLRRNGHHLFCYEPVGEPLASGGSPNLWRMRDTTNP